MKIKKSQKIHPKNNVKGVFAKIAESEFTVPNDGREHQTQIENLLFQRGTSLN